MGLQGDERKYHSSFLKFWDSDDGKPLSKIKEKRDSIQEEIEKIIEESKKTQWNILVEQLFLFLIKIRIIYEECSK